MFYKISHFIHRYRSCTEQGIVSNQNYVAFTCFRDDAYDIYHREIETLRADNNRREAVGSIDDLIMLHGEVTTVNIVQMDPAMNRNNWIEQSIAFVTINK